MENKFYVGLICHTKRIKNEDDYEKVILYQKDSEHYLDLIAEKEYTLDESKKEHVVRDTLQEIDINDFREDYHYLLLRYNNKRVIKKKPWYNFKGK